MLVWKKKRTHVFLLLRYIFCDVYVKHTSFEWMSPKLHNSFLRPASFSLQNLVCFFCFVFGVQSLHVRHLITIHATTNDSEKVSPILFLLLLSFVRNSTKIYRRRRDSSSSNSECNTTIILVLVHSRSRCLTSYFLHFTQVYRFQNWANQTFLIKIHIIMQK